MSAPEIDFVITWVDGNDQAWQGEKKKYLPPSEVDDAPERYRDWDLLPYWFRGVEQYAPWARRIHFITWGHIPDWLNTDHPKLRIVNHRDYIPEEYLPTFNSNVIEMHMHRIKDLSEHFVYFNDDMILINKVKPQDYFVDGKPCDMLAFQPVVANPANPVMSHIYLNNALVLSKYYDKRQNVKKQPFSYFKAGYPPLYFFYNMLELFFPLFTGFYTVHGAFPLCKSTLCEIWQKEEERLCSFSRQRFRSNEDVSLYLVREWQKLSGAFHAKNITRNFGYFNVSNENHKLIQAIEKKKVSTVCINDANEHIDFQRAKAEILQALQKIMPVPSSFERQAAVKNR